MLKIEYHSQFKKDYKLAIKRGCNVNELQEVLKYLVNEEPLPKKYDDHYLKGKYAGYKECHIEPDWLLIYQIEKNLLILKLIRTGTHSDLFKK